ncbi:hypothetical protein ES706_03755 [subsurface metagenome]
MAEEEKFEVEMEYERQTKRTFRFKEAKEPIRIGTLYVQKTAFATQPKRIHVTVEVVE